MTRQRLGGRRRGDLGALRAEIAAWASDGDTDQREVDWRVKINVAHCGLKAIFSKFNQ